IFGGHRELRIDRRTRAAERGLKMAAAAAIEIHAWTETFTDAFFSTEFSLTRAEVIELRSAETRHGPTRGGIARSDTGIFGFRAADGRRTLAGGGYDGNLQRHQPCRCERERGVHRERTLDPQAQ